MRTVKAGKVVDARIIPTAHATTFCKETQMQDPMPSRLELLLIYLAVMGADVCVLAGIGWVILRLVTGHW